VEFVEGDDLSQRIARGASLDEALPIRQIAGAQSRAQQGSSTATEAREHQGSR
jgi:hypothetical protein